VAFFALECQETGRFTTTISQSKVQRHQHQSSDGITGNVLMEIILRFIWIGLVLSPEYWYSFNARIQTHW
jgi:hypothetical protein